ncbi:homeotic protein spalt-major isoform X3 [Nilaparvata lugens]|uniref:homeotic protein spalt-major isoform X3 n=1 Tax=Nilaparvata lugens TaxID=108931 RepID=UPI00193D2812|nr:homeotic protein spalt-major isoform X3 [Nilaparvata lugens]
MSRRKQARPFRVLESEDGTESTAAASASTSASTSAAASATVATAAVNTGESSGSSSEEDSGSTSGCKLGEELGCEAEKENEERKDDPDSPMSVENDETMATGDEDEEEECVVEEGISKTREEARRQRQDAENNNSIGEGEAEVDADADADADSLAGDLAGLGFQGLGGFPVPPVPGHVTLEALQNTKVAVAQFAATAMANNADNPAALQNLAVLHSTIYTLQTQQMMQLRLIQQLQQQLQDNGGLPPVKEASPPTTPLQLSTPLPLVEPPAPPVAAAAKHQPNTSSAANVVGASVTPSTPPATQSIPPSSHSQALTPTSTKPPTPKPPPTSPPAQPAALPPCSISSSFASSIITNFDPPPSPNGPNSLEMLKRRTEDMLDNASQSLLANNNMADEVAFKKRAAYDSKSGVQLSLKHCCRYCGKVFGSDSALQIHIRSHTGERPFKCNVCGSRFTTKGNLKVHFQRHTSKFPHIKMNPNPVPEHLDKYHPPLIAQMGAHQSLPPGAPPHHPHQIPHPPFPNSPPFPPASLPMYRPPQPPPHDLLLPPHHRPQDPSLIKPILPLSLYSPRGEQEMPENLSKPANSSSPPMSESGERFKKENIDEEMRIKSESGDPPHANSRLSPKQELEAEGESEHDPDNERYPSPSPYDDCSLDSKYSNEDLLAREDSPSKEENDDSLQEQPENLSNKSTSDIVQFSISADQQLPPSFPFPGTVSPPSSTSSGDNHLPGSFSVTTGDFDPSQDPAIYSNLLPRPGSNDNSWESLIEITKTSETSKLQQLVDNIEHKLTDPNQCIICQRVLSCKSALQMHYRTHTGERPFKCKICGRAFTTKGNLKTHMGVHRIKPPMRVLHQCPVCHKKFTNGLVLQQHIRLHTGEPTDLSPEQIQAAEIKDYLHPPSMPSLSTGSTPSPSAFLHLSQVSNDSFLSPGLSRSPISGSQDEKHSFGSDIKSKDNSKSDEVFTSCSPMPSYPAFSTSLAALENQVRTIDTIASHFNTASHLKNFSKDLCNNQTFTPIPVNGEKSPAGSRGLDSPSGSEGQLTPSPHPSHPVQIPRSAQRPPSPAPSESNSLGALDLTPRAHSVHSTPGVSPAPAPPPHFSSFGLLPPVCASSPLMTSALSTLTSSVLNSTAFSPIGLAVGPGVRGNTTCNLCFKTFACNSALEIHYRSHTKERPFKCTICDRGFSTKGNMKQHMLTHKIRDMPPHLFEHKSGSSQMCSDEASSNASSEGLLRPMSVEPPLSLPPAPAPGLSSPGAASMKPELPSAIKRSRSPLLEEPALTLPKRQPSTYGHTHVDERGFTSRPPHVSRPASPPKGLRLPASEARPFLSLSSGPVP